MFPPVSTLGRVAVEHVLANALAVHAVHSAVDGLVLRVIAMLNRESFDGIVNAVDDEFGSRFAVAVEINVFVPTPENASFLTRAHFASDDFDLFVHVYLRYLIGYSMVESLEGVSARCNSLDEKNRYT